MATALTAKGLAVSSFCGMFIFGSELLPTACRGLGLGLCGCSARTGSLLAPQLMALVSCVFFFLMQNPTHSSYFADWYSPYFCAVVHYVRIVGSGSNNYVIFARDPFDDSAQYHRGS